MTEQIMVRRNRKRRQQKLELAQAKEGKVIKRNRRVLGHEAKRIAAEAAKK